MIVAALRTVRHKAPRPRQGERDAEGWRGERQAYPAPGEGGNFHITLTPALSQRERELAVRPLAPGQGENSRSRVRGRKKEIPLMGYRP